MREQEGYGRGKTFEIGKKFWCQGGSVKKNNVCKS